MTNKEKYLLGKLRKLFIEIIAACILFMVLFLGQQLDFEVFGVTAEGISMMLSQSLLP